jgi:hypothetical protein
MLIALNDMQTSSFGQTIYRKPVFFLNLHPQVADGMRKYHDGAALRAAPIDLTIAIACAVRRPHVASVLR